MNEQKFFELFGDIDPEIIAAADRPIPVRKRRGIKIMLIAAVLALALLIAPIAGAFALAGSYKAKHPDFHGNLIEALDRALGTQDMTFSGLITKELLEVDQLHNVFSPEGNVNWSALIALLQGKPSDPAPESSVFQTIQIDENSLRIVGYTGKQETVKIPESIDGIPVTEIGEHVFAKDETVTHVIIPDTVKLIDKGAFTLCINLQTLEMSESVEKIGDSAFFGCHALTEVNLPETLHTLDTSAFGHCYSLKQIVIPSSLTELGDAAFIGSGLEYVTIPEGLTVIPEMAFANLQNLQQVTVPHSVEIIEICAFEGCENLEQITLQDGLLSIGRQAFSGTAISSITIPSTVTNMYDIGFSECKNLETVTFLGNAPEIELLPNSVTTDNSSYESAPKYTVKHFMDATGFAESEWFGYVCTIIPDITQSFISDSQLFGVIPHYKSTVLKGEFSNPDTEQVVLIDSYKFYQKFQKQYSGTDGDFSYDRSYFDHYSIVLIEYTHPSSEQILGFAGLGIQHAGATGTGLELLAPVIMIDAGQQQTADINKTYITVEILKTDLKQVESYQIFAYNMNPNGPRDGSSYPSFPIIIKN